MMRWILLLCRALVIGSSLVSIRCAPRQQVRRTQRPDRCISILADDADGENAGLCALELLDCGGPVAQCLMSGLIVRPRWRRQGIARQLVEAAEEQTRSWGYSELLLNVQHSNTPARSLYYSMGYMDFEPVSDEASSDANPGTGLLGGLLQPLLQSQRQLWMRKDL